MTTGDDGAAGSDDGAPEPVRDHTWEGDPKQVFHCTTCGLVTTSTDTVFRCYPRAPQG